MLSALPWDGNGNKMQQGTTIHSSESSSKTKQNTKWISASSGINPTDSWEIGRKTYSKLTIHVSWKDLSVVGKHHHMAGRVGIGFLMLQRRRIGNGLKLKHKSIVQMYPYATRGRLVTRCGMKCSFHGYNCGASPKKPSPQGYIFG